MFKNWKALTISTLAVLLGISVAWGFGPTTRNTTELWNFINGLNVNYKTGLRQSGGTLTIGGSDITTVQVTNATGTSPIGLGAGAGLPDPGGNGLVNRTALNTTAAYAGTTCTNKAVTALDGSGVATCTTLTSAYVDTSIALTGTDINTSNQVTALHVASLNVDTNGIRTVMPTAQTIAAGGIIAADTCGGLKRVTASGAVSTDATNAFTAPATANAGCILHVVNTGANTITIKHSANTLTLTGADLALASKSVVVYGSDGTNWYQLSALGTNS